MTTRTTNDPIHKEEPDGWCVQHEWDVGYHGGLNGTPFQEYWITSGDSTWRKRMNEVYTEAYDAGKKQALINLIKEDPT